MRARRAAPAAAPYRLYLTYCYLVSESLDDELWVQEPVSRIELEDISRSPCHELRSGIHVAVRRPEEELKYSIPNLPLYDSPRRFVSLYSNGLREFTFLFSHRTVQPHHVIGVGLPVGVSPS